MWTMLWTSAERCSTFIYMSNNRKTNPSPVMADVIAARAAAREAEIASGIRRRSVVLNPNRRAKASRIACRGRVQW